MHEDPQKITRKDSPVPRPRRRDGRWQVKKLSAKYMRIVYMLAAGYTQTKIAKELEMSISHINRIANSPLVSDEVHRIQDEWGMALVERRFKRILSNEDECGLKS